jgi:CRISPR-associated endonuclease/helicase Cas3
MWGSRLLFRGYGTSRRARPREAGLLAYDSVVVVDEAHLARQLVVTARRIGILEGMAHDPLPVPGLQVVEVTATHVDLGPGGRSVGVEPGDLEAIDPPSTRLAKRLLSPKPVVVVPVPGWPATGSGRVAIAQWLADEAETLLATHGRTIACVANTVDVALATAAHLRRRELSVELLVGRMRPYDLAHLHRRRPGLLTIDGNPEVDVLVATQTVEVGLDADFAAMVTELAPGSAVAQRAGRVNRLGRRATAEIRVLAPEGPIPPKGAPPYGPGELEDGLAWVKRRAAADGGLAPYPVAQDAPPPAALPRVVLGQPEISDARFLARTSDRLFAEPDLELWLSDDLDADEDVAIVVRMGLGRGPIVDLALLEATPVRPEECFPASIGTVRGLLERDKDLALPYYVVRADEAEPLDEPRNLRPGDTLVTSTDARWFDAGVVVARERGTDTATDVLEDLEATNVLRVGHGLPFASLLGAAATTRLLDQLAIAAAREPADNRARRALMVAAIQDVRDRYGGSGDPRADERLRWSQMLLRGRLDRAEVVVAPAVEPDGPAWVVIADLRARQDEDQARQTWASNATTLDVHQRDVADRAGELGDRVGLSSRLIRVLRDAGAHHDEGKRDPRFQLLLGHPAPGNPDSPALAKSAHRTPAEFRAAQGSCGLPTGWRHEQLSAAVTGAHWSDPNDRPHSELVIRLVGTSHGAGRSGFPHSGTSLCADYGALAAGAGVATASGRLFDEGAWDSLVETTHREHGYWGCAYLEALLRAADGQVSREADA